MSDEEQNFLARLGNACNAALQTRDPPLLNNTAGLAVVQRIVDEAVEQLLYETPVNFLPVEARVITTDPYDLDSRTVRVSVRLAGRMVTPW